MKIIYIHGFNSGGSNNDKVDMLRERFHNVVAIDLPPSPDQAIAMLMDEIAHSDLDELVLVGTSLGAFYAHYLSKTFQIKAVLINPSIYPTVTLAKHVGRLTNYATGVEYDFTAADLAQLANYYVDAKIPRVPTIVALDMDDEVIDANIAISVFSGYAKLLVFKGGNHRFAHMANILDDIELIEHVVYN